MSTNASRASRFYQFEPTYEGLKLLYRTPKPLFHLTYEGLRQPASITQPQPPFLSTRFRHLATYVFSVQSLQTATI